MARVRSGRRSSLPSARATSAGGIVRRVSDGVEQIVLGRRRRERDGETWSLPKGTPNPSETIEQTAVREVAEETGLEVRIVQPVGAIEYFFVLRGTRIHKTVHYFLMEVVGGDLERHDREFEEVRWVPRAEAETLMSFPTERDIVTRALGPARAA